LDITLPATLSLLPAEVFAYALVFARLGSALMILPAFGEPGIPTRVRLLIALAITVVVTPVIASSLPALPPGYLAAAGLIITEIVIGLAIGAIPRIFMAALQTAGFIIAMQTGMAFAMNFDATQGTQSALIGTFLNLTAVTLIFVTDTHHLLLAAARDSYALFPAGGSFPLADFSNLAVRTVSDMFTLGVQIASPFLVFGLIFYMSIGILSRLMPQVQIFFVAMPANILLGFLILMLTISVLMMWFLTRFEEAVMPFLAP